MLCVAITCACAPGCAPAPLAPRGEAIIVVDTDMPIPSIVSHLRVDVYTSDGLEWLTSRDIVEPRPEVWPLSFSLFTPDTGRDHTALLRLRAYPDGYTRDYRGERYSPKPTLLSGIARMGAAFEAPPTTPDTLSSGDPKVCGDNPTPCLITPTTEPAPLTAIDRLLLVRVVPGQVGKVVVTLAGACDGTQADLHGLQTCTDTEGVVGPVPTATLDPDVTLPKTSHHGEFAKPFAIDCATLTPPNQGTTWNGERLYDEEICVQGGVFILGSTDLLTGTVYDDYPTRVAAVPTFFVDKYEYSVSRLRHLLSTGYVPAGTIVAKSQSIIPQSEQCNWTAQPSGAESRPINCIDADLAADLCKQQGGALPTESQWEYATSWAGYARKTVRPYHAESNGSVSCATACFDRAGVCKQTQPVACDVDFAEPVHGDVAALGLVGVAGNVSELTSDAFATKYSNCWMSSPIASAGCVRTDPDEERTVRGGNYMFNVASLTLAYVGSVLPKVVSAATAHPELIGFRCARVASP